MAEYIDREKVLALGYWHGEHPDFDNPNPDGVDAVDVSNIEAMPAADVAEVVRCKDCKYSTLPSELTQRYGKPGTLTCHNRYAPCNRRNVGGDDFCSYGEAREK